LPAAALTAGSAAIAAGPALPPIGDYSRAAGVARARHIVELLSDRFIRDGWHESFDRERAARFIENMQTFDEDGSFPPAVPVCLIRRRLKVRHLKNVL
jgi:hypothetical protein